MGLIQWLEQFFVAIFFCWRAILAYKALPGFFLCIFSSLTCLQQAVTSGVEGSGQPVTISTKCKNPSSALLRKMT